MFLKVLQYSEENTCARVSFYTVILLKKRIWHRGFPLNFARCLRVPFLQNTSRWLLLFYISCWLYTLQLYMYYIYIFFFFYFLWQIPVYFVSYAKRMLYSEQPTVLLAWRHLNRMVLINFENSNFIPNIFQETHDFLVLMDPVNCIYLRTTDKHFRDQGNIRHPTSKWRKCDLVPTLNTFRNPSLRIFAAGKASLVSIVFAIEKKNDEIFITKRKKESKWIRKDIMLNAKYFW